MKRFAVVAALLAVVALVAPVGAEAQCGNQSQVQRQVIQPTQSFSRAAPAASLSQSINTGLTANAQPQAALFAASQPAGGGMYQSMETGGGANATLARFNVRTRAVANTQRNAYAAQPVCTNGTCTQGNTTARTAAAIEIPPEEGGTQQNQPPALPAAGGGLQLNQSIDKTTSFNSGSATVQPVCAQRTRPQPLAAMRNLLPSRAANVQKTVQRRDGSVVQFQRSSG